MDVLKIIFLDIDGVLTSRRCNFNFDTKAIDNLVALVERHKAKVVLCSSWREETLQKTTRHMPMVLRQVITDQAPVLPGKSRSEEIRAWLRTIPGEPSCRDLRFVILDDEAEHYTDFDRRYHLVKTEMETGFQEDALRLADELLGSPGTSSTHACKK